MDPMIYVYNIGFITSGAIADETQVDLSHPLHQSIEGTIELINLLLYLKEEMSIEEITYIDYVESQNADQE